MAYKNGLRMEIRTQLGFALKDVSENLPGAFIIYKADKNDDEILLQTANLSDLQAVRIWMNCLNIQKKFP